MRLGTILHLLNEVQKNPTDVPKPDFISSILDLNISVVESEIIVQQALERSAPLVHDDDYPSRSISSHRHFIPRGHECLSVLTEPLEMFDGASLSLHDEDFGTIATFDLEW